MLIAIIEVDSYYLRLGHHMKLYGLPVSFLILAAVATTSCESKAGTGAAIGGGLGAASGALITGGSVQGALIGGAIGAIGGAVIGSALDEQDRKIMERDSPKTLRKVDNGEPLSIEDVKAMSRAHISNEVIISQIQATRSVFHLTSQEIIDLKDAHVSQEVIDYMIQTGY
jgi:outer membrane lipoprotein SlyB